MAAPRIAILTSNFWPEQTGTSQTVTEFATYLADHGLDVEVATSMPYYPQWAIWPDYRGPVWTTERHAGMVIHRSWHLVSPRPSTLTRLLHEATLSLLALPNMLRVLRGAASAYVVSPALSYAFVGLFVARLLRVRATLIVKDVMPDAAIELGMLRSPVMIAVSRFLARRAYAWAVEIHTLGEGMRRRIARDTARPTKIHIVPDTIAADELAPVPAAENEFRRRFVPNGTFAVLHTGNMGRKQDLQLLLRAARRLRDSAVHFYVFGDGAAKDEFLRLRREWDLEALVSHHPLQERWMLRHMLSGADLVLVSQLPEVVDIVVPSKLLTAMGAGAMIVAACAAESEAARLIRESGGGLVIPASDDAALVEAIARLRVGEVDTAACRRDARAFAVRTFDRESVYSPLVKDLRGPAPGSGRAIHAV